MGMSESVHKDATNKKIELNSVPFDGDSATVPGKGGPFVTTVTDAVVAWPVTVLHSNENKYVDLEPRVDADNPRVVEKFVLPLERTTNDRGVIAAAAKLIEVSLIFQVQFDVVVIDTNPEMRNGEAGFNLLPTTPEVRVTIGYDAPTVVK